MRSDAPTLPPILRTWHLAKILTLVLMHSATEHSVSEVAATLGLPLTTVQREVTRLFSSELIRERRVGRSRLVSANPASRHAKPLAELVTLAFGRRSWPARYSVPLARWRWRSTDPGRRARRA
jgi:DNA-binding transcriptional ArsR family regulator